MGKALLLTDVSFRKNNIGHVTFTGGKLKSISIRGRYLISSASTYTIDYTPVNTPQRGVVWSVLSGDASINQEGLLTPNSDGNVTIQAVSTYNPTIKATQNIIVREDKPLNGISIVGPSEISAATTYSVEYDPSDTPYTGVTWSIVSGLGSITQGGTFTPYTTGETVIQAVSVCDPSISATTTVTCSGGYAMQYLTIESLEDDNEIGWRNQECLIHPTIQYSIDNGETWGTITTLKDTIVPMATINTGEKIILKGVNNRISEDATAHQACGVKSTKTCNVYGNALSILKGDNFMIDTALNSGGALKGLFAAAKVVDASNLILPSITIPSNGYNRMFSGCKELINPPVLPATTIENNGYNRMFSGCTSLVTPPELPATTLGTSSYVCMFDGCISMTTAPELPASALTSYCYDKMFERCYSLTTPPVLSATTLAPYCYQYMFQYCSGLTSMPELPATTLDVGCYRYMFNMSSSKSYNPMLKETTVLLASTVPSQAYAYMFCGNGNLEKITCLATQMESDSCSGWTTNLESFGTFVKAEGATWSIGNDGIPSGWTVYEYGTGLSGMTIEGDSTITETSKYVARLQPSASIHSGVTWSVISGNASITQDGMLSPSGDGVVVIEAVSDYDPSISARTTVTVDSNYDYSQDYFYIKSLEDDNLITITTSNKAVIPTFDVSYDNGQTWWPMSAKNDGTVRLGRLNTGDKLIFSGNNVKMANSWDKYSCFNGTKQFSANGNAMSLLNGDNYTTNSEFSNDSGSTYNLCSIFKGSDKIVDAKNLSLPATICTEGCYNGMFRDCPSLKTAPKLPSLNISFGCYSSMFESCINLEEAPELPATTLATQCYLRMFCMNRDSKVTTPKMTKSPVLLASYIDSESYKDMFRGNGNLNEITCLATSRLNTGSTNSWVLNISSSGTFKKDANATFWGTGINNIPNGWTVEDYTSNS